MLLHEAIIEGMNSYKPPNYRHNYYMTEHDYKQVMKAIDNFWQSKSTGSQTFWRSKIVTSIRGHYNRSKINP